MKIKKFYEPVLMADVYFITDCKHTEVEAWLHRKKITTIESYSLLSGFVTDWDSDGCKQYLFWVESKKDFYTLLHESNHLVHRILEHRGIPYTSDNTEIIAYYQTFWFKKLWRFMSKK